APPPEAEGERGRRLAAAADLETAARAAFAERVAAADQPFVSSHERSSAIDDTIASGEYAAKPSAPWAPYVTASALAPALCASSTSWQGFPHQDRPGRRRPR